MNNRIYSDDRQSICKELRDLLKKYGDWAPSDDGPDMITAIGRAIIHRQETIERLELTLADTLELLSKRQTQVP